MPYLHCPAANVRPTQAELVDRATAVVDRYETTFRDNPILDRVQVLGDDIIELNNVLEVVHRVDREAENRWAGATGASPLAGPRAAASDAAFRGYCLRLREALAPDTDAATGRAVRNFDREEIPVVQTAHEAYMTARRAFNDAL